MQTSKVMRFFFVALTLAGFSAHARPATAATLLIQNGELVGADDVLVNGMLYDVRFVEGSCISLFTGCDDPSDLTFTTMADATLASEALLSQVLIDTPQGLYDSVPDLTFGCAVGCFIMTPFGSGATKAAFNAPGVSNFGSVRPGLPPFIDTTALSEFVYADWHRAR